MTEEAPVATPAAAAGPGPATKLAYGCLSIVVSFAGLLLATAFGVALIAEALDLDPDIVFVAIPLMYIAWPFLAWLVYRKAMADIRRRRERSATGSTEGG